MVNKGFKTLVKAPIKTRPLSIMNLNLCLVSLMLVTSSCFTSALKRYRCDMCGHGMAVRLINTVTFICLVAPHNFFMILH